MTDHLERALQERLLARSQVSPRDVEALRLFARTLPARRSFWRGPALRWAMSAATVILAAVVALPLIFRIPGVGTETPAPSSPAPTAPAPTPSTPAPTVAPSLGIGLVPLLVASGSDVNVVIDDPEGLLTGAWAEQAGATMSVRWFDSIVDQVEGTGGIYRIRVTWVGYPRDETVQLQVRRGVAGLSLHLIQDAPPPQSDGEGEDRIIVLEFDFPVANGDVEVTFDYPA